MVRFQVFPSFAESNRDELEHSDRDILAVRQLQAASVRAHSIHGLIQQLRSHVRLLQERMGTGMTFKSYRSVSGYMVAQKRHAFSCTVNDLTPNRLRRNMLDLSGVCTHQFAKYYVIEWSSVCALP
jgi:hypothetical protein